jgi:phosphopantothenoylcysteine synthetase/decarboxylase
VNVLVTAGNTQVPIDRVRCLTNVFTGRTGAAIALEAHRRGHAVTLLTSHPEAALELHDRQRDPPLAECWTVQGYRTFDELRALLESAVRRGGPDTVVHSAAVSDYVTAGVYAPAPGTRFRGEDGRWEEKSGAAPGLVDRGAGKVKSDEPELWLRLVRAPKLIDLMRHEWGFRGVLVKFKLEVGVSEAQLLEIAERSRRHSAADLMAANTLEGAHDWALLGPFDGVYQRVARRELAPRVLHAVERLHGEKGHG